MGIIWTNVLQELSNSQPARHLRINRHGKIISEGSFTQTLKAMSCVKDCAHSAFMSELYIVSEVMEKFNVFLFALTNVFL